MVRSQHAQMVVYGVKPGSDLIEQMQAKEPASECFRFESVWADTVPELYATKRVVQRNGQSVYDHTMRVLDLLDNRRVVCRLAALFHDTGKALCPHVGKHRLTFTGHEQASSILARQRMVSWQLDPWTIDRVCRVIENHMIDILAPFSRRAIRNFVARVGYDNLPNWFSLRMADGGSYGDRPLTEIEDFYRRVNAETKRPVISADELTITVNDLQAVLDLDPRESEAVIQRLVTMVNRYQCENEPKGLLVVARELA